MLIVRHGYSGVPGNNVILYRQDSALVEKHPGHLKGDGYRIIHCKRSSYIDYHEVAARSYNDIPTISFPLKVIRYIYEIIFCVIFCALLSNV